MSKFNYKRKLRKGRVFIVILILIIIIGTIVFTVNRTDDNQEQEGIMNTTATNSVEENNQLVAEISYSEEATWEWQHDTLENHNISVSAIDSVHNTIDEYPINAEVIVKDGVIVDEYYKEGYDPNSIFSLQSTSKSITSAIFGIAIDKGYIENVNVPISNYFPQILDSDSDYLKEITIGHLLTHTSGFNASDTGN